MAGDAIAWYLLKTNAPLTAVVPAARIQGETLPLGITLPAISVTHVSGTQKNTLAMGDPVYIVEHRVQVSVQAKTKPELRSILALVRAALPSTNGAVNGFTVQAILPDSEGPMFTDTETGVRSQSHDFMVWFLR